MYFGTDALEYHVLRKPLLNTKVMTLKITSMSWTFYFEEVTRLLYRFYWSNDRQSHISMLHLLYFQEVMPWSAVVCPSGYFMSKLKYHFSVPGSDSDERPPAFNANPFNENLPQPAGGAGPPPGGGGGGPQQGFPQGGNVPPRMPPNMQGMPPNMQGMPPNMNIKGALPNFPGRPPANMRPLPAYRRPMEQYGGPRNTDPWSPGVGGAQTYRENRRQSRGGWCLRTEGPGKDWAETATV